MSRSILIPTDGNEATKPAIEHGLRIAANRDATVHALYVVDIPPVGGERAEESLEPLVSKLEAEGKEATGNIAVQAHDKGLDVKKTVKRGIPFQAILDYTDAHDIECIAMGTGERDNPKSYFLGSTARKITRLSRVPVLTVRASKDQVSVDYRSILLPVDGTQGSQRAIETCTRLASDFDAIVHILYVIDSRIARAGSLVDLMEMQGEQACYDAASRMKIVGVDSTDELLHGRPAEQILSYADNHDIGCIVIGTHGRTGIDRFVMGSVAEKVVRRAPMPVLTVRDLGRE
ncbi:universal stress protein [Haladaptatus sp. CMAA 1911]|uniref:universal stress protein n=1 Tax=unclassified Haladaptatus TaxID=2622732 RepID=UPI003753FFB1